MPSQQDQEIARATGAKPPAPAKPAAAPPSGKRKMTPSEVGRLGALARQGKYKAKKKELKGRKKASPEEAAAAREAKRRQEATDNRATVMSELGLFEDATDSLNKLAMGEAVDDDGGLEKMGLAERGKDGTLRLTAAGRTFYNAASRGDTGAAKDTLGRAKDATSTRAEKAKAKADAAAEKEKAKAAEKEKPKAGGGGGGGGKDKPKPEEKDKAAERAQTAQDTAAQLPPATRIKPREVDALRRATTGDDVDEAEVDGLIEMGFVQPKPGGGFEATDQGRAAHTALERGNRSQYEAAIQNARGRLEREGAAQQRKKDAGERASERQTAAAERTRTRLAEKERREAERQTRRKKMDRTAALRVLGETNKGIAMELDTIVDTLTAVAVALDTDDDAVKAGRRNSGGDQAKLDEIYAAAAAICDLCEALGATQDEDEAVVELKTLPPAEIPEWSDGDAVKALGADRIGGLAVRFGSEDEPDASVYRDYFTKSTAFWLDQWQTRPMLYHHAMDESTADDPVIGTWTKAAVTDEGVWLEGELSKAYKYQSAIKELVRRGALRISTDSAPHLVRRAAKAGAHEVTRWPIVAASLTVSPAEPRLHGVSFKALLAEIGLDAIDSPQATDPDPVEVAPDQATKTATDDRARRLLLTLDIVALETA